MEGIFLNDNLTLFGVWYTNKRNGRLEAIRLYPKPIQEVDFSHLTNKTEVKIYKTKYNERFFPVILELVYSHSSNGEDLYRYALQRLALSIETDIKVYRRFLIAIHDLKNEESSTLPEDRLKEFKTMFGAMDREKSSPQQAAEFLLNELFIPYKE
jgi:hypothetical protein